MTQVLVQTEDFDVQALNQSLVQAHKGQVGALLSFVGFVRDFSPTETTTILELEHYPGMCEREIQQLCDTAQQRWDILDVKVVHRVGRLHREEQIVYVGVCSAHRGQAFLACEYIIDALKTRAPFWKREILEDGGHFWVQQHEADAEKTARWEVDSAPTNA